VKPELVANFEFATWTKSGRIRKPATFLGFRKDKKAKQVVREVPKEVDVVEEQIDESTKRSKSTMAGSNWPKLEAIKTISSSEMQIGDCSITLTDVDRVLWKGVTKARLLEYYHAVSKYILPHLKDRPLSLHVKPKGPNAPGLYIKDMEGREPDCASIFVDKRRHSQEGKRDTIDYLICNNEATLLYLINLGCIDVNPWMSRKENAEQPDFFNIDLDPSDEDFEKVIEVAIAAKQVLDRYKLKAFPKTSGKTGLHIYVPIEGIGFEQARNYSEMLGREIQKMVPKISTVNVSINSRGNKVFIDPSQNDYADTLAAAYSVRPHKVPGVSTPLEWKEIKSGLDPKAFTIDTVLNRIKKKGDLFKDVLDRKIARGNALQSKK
jgi:bifunctional non-homologous end joining protein LigD